MTTSPLLIRADAHTRIGSGHVMRCLALAQAWQETGGPVTFVCHADLPASLHQRLLAEGAAVVLYAGPPGSHQDAAHLTEQAQAHDAAAVVVDGYHFGAAYQRQIKAADLRLLFIDDNGHADHYHADFVLNPNIHASESYYAHRDPHTQLLLGTDYALLRREFWPYRAHQRLLPDRAQNLLITLGGSDPDNITLAVLQSLAQLPDAAALQVRTVIGGGNPHRAGIAAFVDQSALAIEVLHDVRDMPALIAWADVALSAGGGTIWELALLGTPSVVIVTADNQARGMAFLSQRGLIDLLQTPVTPAALGQTLAPLIADRTRRQQIATQLQALVDGYGVQRVTTTLSLPVLHLRPATSADCRLLFDWANDKKVREMSFSPDPIAWDNHQRWFDAKFNNPDTVIYIAEDRHGQPIGQMRFDIDEPASVIVDVSIDHKQRGNGFGKALIWYATRRFCQEHAQARNIYAVVKVENVGSVNAFKKAGYLEDADHEGTYGSVRYVYRCSEELDNAQ